MTERPEARYPNVETQPRFPEIEERVLAYWAREGIFRESVERRPAGENGANEYVFYDGPPVRQRPAALWAPAHRLRQGHRAALPDDARPPRRAPLRLGLPRPAGRDGGREGARRLRSRRRSSSTASTRFNDALPHARCCATRRSGSSYVTRQARWVDFDERLQDHGPLLHGERHVGLQAALGQGPRLRRRPRHAVLVGGRDAALELRDAPRRLVSRRARTRRSRCAFADRASDGDARPTRRAGRGRRRRGRCRRTWRSRSVPTIDYAIMRASGERCVLIADRGARSYDEGTRGRAQVVDAAQGRELVGGAIEPLFPYFAEHRERVPRARRRLRRHRRGHRHRAHGAGLRRGRPEVCRGERHRAGRARSTTRGRFTARGAPTGRASNVLRRQQADHPRAEGARRRSSGTRPSCTTTRTAGAPTSR